jgi:hyperosmotically inducible protein
MEDPMNISIRRGFLTIVAALSLVAFGSVTTAAQVAPIKDGWITFKVHSQFVPEDVLEGSNIDVDTVSGAVTLRGTVPTAAARTRAIAIAKATDGVKSVSDKLAIGPAESAVAPATKSAAKGAATKKSRAVTDGWIKSKIYAQFLADWNVLDDSNINIDVAKGVVTLKGTVKSAAAHTRAVAIAKATDGVKSVADQLKVAAR